jgi:hypothetical protein
MKWFRKSSYITAGDNAISRKENKINGRSFRRLPIPCESLLNDCTAFYSFGGDPSLVGRVTVRTLPVPNLKTVESASNRRPRLQPDADDRSEVVTVSASPAVTDGSAGWPCDPSARRPAARAHVT